MDYKADLTFERNRISWERRELHGGPYGPTHVEIDFRVQCVLEFMEREVKPTDLIGVARAIALVAPVLWSNFPDIEIYPMMLEDGDVKPVKKFATKTYN